MPRTPTVSPDRILQVAAREFADRGYAGARVDRIARLARVNKAMLYYHFGSKKALYRALLRQVFAHAGERLKVIADGPGPADRKIHDVIGAIGAFVAEHAFFPAIMLREVADGGVHLDRETLAALAALPLTVGAIVRQGVAERTLRPLNPIAAYFTMFAPIVMFMTGAPLRGQLTSRQLLDMSKLPPERFIEQLQESIRLAFSAR